MNLLQEWGEKIEALGPVAKQVGDRCENIANAILDKLTSIDAGIANLYPDVGAYEYPRLPLTVAGGPREVSGREGFTKIIESIAIIGAAAADVDIFLLTPDSAGFVKRVSLAAAGRTSQDVKIPVPEAASFYVSVSADAQVNMIVKRVSL